MASKKLKSIETTLYQRLSGADAHYAGQLVSGARVLELFGDAATELLIRCDGTEGLFRAYETVEFLAPVRAGDFLEIRARIVHIGNTSRKIDFLAHKIIEAKPTSRDIHAAKVLTPPLLVAKASGTCVVPKK